MELKTKCPICLKLSAYVRLAGNSSVYGVKCDYCGDVYISQEAIDYISPDNRMKITGVLLERKIKNLPTVAIFRERTDKMYQFNNYRIVTLKELENMFPNEISDRIDRVLENFTGLSSYHGYPVNIDGNSLALFFCKTSDVNELFFLIIQLNESGYITGGPVIPSNIVVTAKGWNRVAEIENKRKENGESNQAFIAMWFDKSMNSVAENGFEQAISDTGFEPLRIDRKETIDKIDDEIIAEIKRSKFVVADFTGHRGGVYFEAGYAMGLGKPVIWTCRDIDLKNLHFDTRQYSHIVWSNEEDLYTKLLNRIRATII